MNMKLVKSENPQSLTLDYVLKGLVSDNHISVADAEATRRDGSVSRLNPIVIVASRKLKSLKTERVLTAEYLIEWLANRTNMTYFHIDPIKLDFSKAGKIVSKSYAEHLKIIPLKVAENVVTIATADPFNLTWIPELESALKIQIEIVLSNPIDIGKYLPEVYSLSSSMAFAEKSKAGASVGVQNFEQLVELGKSKTLDANEQHIVHIVDWLFTYAFDQRASDIHLEPRRDTGTVRFRIDGVMHQVYQMPSSIMNAITSRIKLLGRMDMVEKRRPQDGRIKTKTPAGEEVEMRLSTMPTAFGEKLVARIFDPDTVVKDFSALGFTDDNANVWSDWVVRPNGIILVTGPTGSGKTTTLYSTLKQLASEDVNVCTVEDPIEMIEPSFNQMQVNSAIGLNFADGVRTLLRQDPDIIMIGEIRDQETAEMAIQAALTGHLVLSTLHTNDAAAAITRLMDLGIPPYLLSSTLIGVMAQRLVRTLCPHCKQKAELSDAEWAKLVSPWKSATPSGICVPNGCLDCRMTGYKGRVGLYEMLSISESMQDLISEHASLKDLRQQACKEGMRSLRVAGAMKVAHGLTTLDEVVKNTPTFSC